MPKGSVQIHIDRSGQRFGPYTLEEVNSYLVAGNVLPTDLGWHDGMGDWVPVREIAGVKLGNAAPPPPPGNQITTTNCPQCGGATESGQVICMGCGHQLQAGPKKSKKGLVIGLSIGSGVLLIGLMVMLFFFLGDGGASTSQGLGEIIYGSLKDGDFEKFKKASVFSLGKDQIKNLTRGMMETMLEEMGKGEAENPLAKVMVDSFGKKLDNFDKEFDENWVKMKERRDKQITEFESAFKDIINKSKEDGVVWPQAKLGEVRFNNKAAKSGGKFGISPKGFEEGELLLIILHEAKKYKMTVNCANTKEYGWLIGDDNPEWGGEE